MHPARLIAFAFAFVVSCITVVAPARGAVATDAAARPPLPVRSAPIRLGADHAVTTPPLLEVWLDRSGKASLADARAQHAQVHAVAASTTFALQPGTALWVYLPLVRERGADAAWVLDIPLPTLDRVAFHMRSADGRWVSSEAGDRVPQGAWPRHGRHPQFGITLPAGTSEPVEVYLRVEHGWPTPLPLRLLTEAQAQDSAVLEYLFLGGIFGGLLLLMAAGCWRAWWLRDPGYAWFAAFGAAALVGVAAYTGVAGHLLWGEFTSWTDIAPGVTCLACGGLALAVVAQLTALASRGRWLWWTLWSAAALGPLLALAYSTVLPRALGVAVVGAYLTSVAAMSFVAGVAAWRHGDAAGRWLMAGAVPLTIAVFLALARLLGWIEGAWAIEYASIAAIAWDLPLLKAALDGRSFERRSARLRQQALASHDPLTGLLRGGPFRARVAAAIERLRRSGEPAAVVAVQVRNIADIAQARGAEAAEECLLRAVLKIQSLVRDVDIVARVGDASFGILFEGVGDRRVTSAFASHLIATGLMEDRDHPDDPALQFHLAVALLHEHAAAHPILLDHLLRILAAMPSRTRKPVRYLAPPDAPADSRPAAAANAGDTQAFAN